MRHIAIVGGGQAGLPLALGLLARGYHVTVVTDRSPDEIRQGKVMSSQCLFDTALQIERDLGLDDWGDRCPPVEGLGMTIVDGEGRKGISWQARLDRPARSVDQRVKFAGWMEKVEGAGGKLLIQEGGLAELEILAATHDLVVLAAGKGEVARGFERDAAHSPFDRPQRALALTYVNGLAPTADFSRVSYNVIQGIGEYFTFPALTHSGPCHAMTFEGLPGGPMDCWQDVTTPEAHLARSLEILKTYLPWEADRCRHVELTDANAIRAGGYPPVVRKPILTLPSGRLVLGLGDAVVRNDPITGQGANNATKAARVYLDAIIERGDLPFSAAWMQQTFERYWAYARPVVEWTNANLVEPPPHRQRLMAAAAASPAVASAIVNGFDHPPSLMPWWNDAAGTEAFIAARQSSQADDRPSAERAGAGSSAPAPLDWGSTDLHPKSLRNVLGSYPTGVAIVATRTADGRRIGLTINSFASLSLDPPLVLWSLVNHSSNLEAFRGCSHFTINVLAHSQAELAMRFANSKLADKFDGAPIQETPEGIPAIDGAVATLVCANDQQSDAGDHLLLFGRVLRIASRAEAPLVFHAGKFSALGAVPPPG